MARGIMLYLKDGIAEDEQIMAVWNAASESGRPQELFRRLLMLGIRAAHERGEMTRAAMEVIDLSVVQPLGGRAPVRAPAPGVPVGWQLGDTPLVKSVKKPRGRAARKAALPSSAEEGRISEVSQKTQDVPEILEEPSVFGGLGRLMG